MIYFNGMSTSLVKEIKINREIESEGISRAAYFLFFPKGLLKSYRI